MPHPYMGQKEVQLEYREARGLEKGVNEGRKHNQRRKHWKDGKILK